ncbi:MAG: DUF3854 domain-containing protein, partial [bacterium]
MALHPEHLADLRRSGLSDETISALEIHSARPGDIPRLIGWNPKEVTSVLVFPYPGEAGFYRVNVFPAFVDKNGRKVKYLQRSGTGVRLYVPPLATRHLTNPYEPLAWTEGEKKAARACQEGIACIGLGGLWNWMEDKKPIPKLDEVAHVGRKELIYGDADVWIRPDLQRAIYAFGMALEARGAKVEFVILPPGLNGEKQGLDDFLVEKGKEELKELRRINLKDKAFSQTKEWYQDWIKSRDIISEPIKAPDPMSESERDEALALLKDPRFLARFLDAIEKVGCVGEEENKLALYMTFTSRLLCQPINNVVKGESAAGKNFLVSAVGRFFPPEDVKFISSATEKAFYYLPEDLSHKVVVIAERHGAEDADYSIRTFQSEGNLIILVPEKDDNGRIVTRERVVKGPAAFIETTTRPHLHPENETRTFDLFLDESEKQTEAIFDAQDRRYLGQGTDADGRLVIWRNAQRLLKVTPVTIPYVTAIRFPPKPLRVRRDRLRVLAMIEACTILHQFQRERKEVNECAYLVASLDDYAIVRELANKMLGPALKGATPKCEELVSQASA